jgi:hypothetical protein
VRALLFAAAVALLASAPVGAWNTDDSRGWASVYITTRPRQELPPAEFIGDEHTELSHLALARLGVAPCFGIAPAVDGACSLRVVDLNASLLRPQVGQLPALGDDDATPLEERWLPPPAHFSGLPDFSWAVYDWINKNTLCAGLPGGSNVVLGCDCHLFAGWLGLFNANHFGTQARTMYERYHRIALRLAARARDLRLRLERSALPADAEAHRDYVREAELEALTFEAVGQHFLQDRWSMGHMWERWGGADVPTVPNPLDAGQAAIASGLLHGHEGLSGIPDPMGAPVIGLFGATPVEWRTGTAGREPGVGDYRLADVYDGFLFETDTPLAVPAQKARMIECSMAGWAEVIQAFGGSAWPVLLAGQPAFRVLEHEPCWDNWATNAAIREGWFDGAVVTGLDVLTRGRLAVTLGQLPIVDCVPFTGSRPGTDWAAAIARIALANHPLLGDPEDTSLARGGLGPLGSSEPGNAYGTYVPEYTEPENLDDLPPSDPTRGRDREAMYGFFNRAHADFWCMGLDAELAKHRGSSDPVKLAACAYLADRVYKGTDPLYQGERREVRQYDAGREIDPICAHHGVRTTGVVEALPYYLHPGYVATPYTRGTYAHRSIEAWCRKLPVLDRVGPPVCPDGSQLAGASNDPDVVARHGVNASGAVQLLGRNLGAAGEVWAGTGENATRLTVLRWEGAEILLDIPPGSLPKGLYPLEVRPAGSERSGWSVGRFLLDVVERFCPCPGPGVVIPPECEQPIGQWRFRTDLRPFHDEFAFAEDGTVTMCGQNCQLWQKVGTWSTDGRSVRIDPCPAETNRDGLTIRFEGTWSPRPEAEGFPVRSCGPRPCPAMRGELTKARAGFPPPPPIPVTTAGAEDFPGWRPFDVPQDQRCSGGCWELWRPHWPHQCAPYQFSPPLSFACGDQVAPQCGGQCPERADERFACRELDTRCRCLRMPSVTCGPGDPPCPADMTCTTGDICFHDYFLF